MIAGLTPYGLITGVISEQHGLSLVETALMSAAVFAGAGQILALGAWTHPAPVLTASFACLAVNLRMVLVGPPLLPWLNRLRGWKLWGTLFVMTDLVGGLSITAMRAGERDAAFLLGAGLSLWAWWVLTSVGGFLVGTSLHLPQGHPLFFAIIAAFVAILVPMWRGRSDVMPWLGAGVTALAVSRALPGTYLYIVAGAVVGSLLGALRRPSTA